MQSIKRHFIFILFVMCSLFLGSQAYAMVFPIKFELGRDDQERSKLYNCAVNEGWKLHVRLWKIDNAYQAGNIYKINPDGTRTSIRERKPVGRQTCVIDINDTRGGKSCILGTKEAFGLNVRAGFDSDGSVLTKTEGNCVARGDCPVIASLNYSAAPEVSAYFATGYDGNNNISDEQSKNFYGATTLRVTYKDLQNPACDNLDLVAIPATQKVSVNNGGAGFGYNIYRRSLIRTEWVAHDQYSANTMTEYRGVKAIYGDFVHLANSAGNPNVSFDVKSGDLICISGDAPGGYYYPKYLNHRYRQGVIFGGSNTLNVRGSYYPDGISPQWIDFVFGYPNLIPYSRDGDYNGDRCRVLPIAEETFQSGT